MRGGPERWLLIAPALALYLALLAGPLAELAIQSVLPSEPTVAGGAGATLDNFLALGSGGFVRVLVDTLRISVIATCLSVAVGYLIAHYLARRCSRQMRLVWINIIVSILFLSLLIRIYAIALTFGPAGLMPYLTDFFGVHPTSRALTEWLVILGLINFTMPLVVLSLLGAVENINPRLMQAAQSMGAPYWKAFFTIDVALSLPNIVSIAVIAFSLSISAFLIPLILGRGFVDFVANLIYMRFSAIYDFSSGAAMAVIMLLLTMIIVYGLQRLIRPKA